MQTIRRPHSVFWPLLLIGLGLFLLFKTLGYITGETTDILLRLWPLLFIVGGLDSLYRRESYVAPLLWIGLGTIILLSNFGYFRVDSWLTFLRLWPVLLIAWGLDLLIGHHGIWSAALGVIVGLLLIAGVFAFAMTQPQVGIAPAVVQVNQALQGATSASVKIQSATGALNVTGGTGPLVTGEARVPANMNVKQNYAVANGHGSYSIDAGQVSGVVAPFFNTRDYSWKLALAGSVPLDLDFTQAVGEQSLDLTGLDLNSLHAETALGQNTIILPDSGSFDGQASVAIGELLIRVPRGAAVRLQLDTAIASVSLPADFTRDGNIATSPGAQGASNPIRLTVNVPIGALRVEYTD